MPFQLCFWTTLVYQINFLNVAVLPNLSLYRFIFKIFSEFYNSFWIHRWLLYRLDFWTTVFLGLTLQTSIHGRPHGLSFIALHRFTRNEKPKINVVLISALHSIWNVDQFAEHSLMSDKRQPVNRKSFFFWKYFPWFYFYSNDISLHKHCSLFGGVFGFDFTGLFWRTFRTVSLSHFTSPQRPEYSFGGTQREKRKLRTNKTRWLTFHCSREENSVFFSRFARDLLRNPFFPSLSHRDQWMAVGWKSTT